MHGNINGKKTTDQAEREVFVVRSRYKGFDHRIRARSLNVRAIGLVAWFPKLSVASGQMKPGQATMHWFAPSNSLIGLDR